MEFLAGLPAVSAGILVFVFLLIVFQEAVNGFHDTANAVATVIYANAMKPLPAVALAAVWLLVRRTNLSARCPFWRFCAENSTARPSGHASCRHAASRTPS